MPKDKVNLLNQDVAIWPLARGHTMQFAKPDRHVRRYPPYRPSVPEPIRLKIAVCAEN